MRQPVVLTVHGFSVGVTHDGSFWISDDDREGFSLEFDSIEALIRVLELFRATLDRADGSDG